MDLGESQTLLRPWKRGQAGLIPPFFFFSFSSSYPPETSVYFGYREEEGGEGNVNKRKFHRSGGRRRGEGSIAFDP